MELDSLARSKSHVSQRISLALTILMLTTSLSPLPCRSAEPRVDPETGRVRILYIGDGWGRSPVPYYRSDPAFTVVSVPASEFHLGQLTARFDLATMKKFVRLYMPRTREGLFDGYDLVILSDANEALIDAKHQGWVKDAVREEGLGLLMVGGLESFGAPRARPWTSLEDSLPVDLILGGWFYQIFKVRPARDHPFTASLPWSTMPHFRGMNRVTLKQGAVLLLTSDVPYPPLSYIDIGNGRSVAHAMDWSRGGGVDITIWEYFGDYVANIAFLVTRSEIPQDVDLLHSLRSDFLSARLRIGSVIDVANFVERFGAKTTGLQEKIAQANEQVRLAERPYISHDYQLARDRIRELFEYLDALQEEAMRLKDRALFWVGIVEWALTLSVTLFSGFVLWTLMVRRRLYRAVGTTRLSDS